MPARGNGDGGRESFLDEPGQRQEGMGKDSIERACQFYLNTSLYASAARLFDLRFYFFLRPLWVKNSKLSRRVAHVTLCFLRTTTFPEKYAARSSDGADYSLDTEPVFSDTL
jgi:hypothetical protein